MINYGDFKNPHAKAERPYNPPTRGLNTALHGAGSKVEGSRTPSPRYVDRRDAGDYGYGGERIDRGISPKSEQWLRDICEKRQLPGGKGRTGEEQATAIIDRLDRGLLDQAAVSRAIDLFKDCPRKSEIRNTDDGFRVVTEQTDEQRVVAYLRGRRDAGTINDFGADILSQYEQYGRLSDRQVEVMLRGIPSYAPAAPKEASPVEPPLPHVPTGRYAVDNAAGELTFYRVKNAKDGHKVWIHVKAGPAEHEVPFSWKGYRTILQSIIDADPLEAALRYGRELKCCSVCASDLTNRLSRELGIGPVCGGRYYEDPTDWTEVKRQARAAIRQRGEDPNEVVA